MIKINSNLQIKNLKSHLTEARLIQLLEQKRYWTAIDISGLVSKILKRICKKNGCSGKQIRMYRF